MSPARASSSRHATDPGLRRGATCTPAQRCRRGQRRQSHHAGAAAAAGESLTLFNGSGGEYAASIEEFRKDSVAGRGAGTARRSSASRRCRSRSRRASRAASAWIGLSRRRPSSASRASCRCSPNAAWCAWMRSRRERKLQHWRGIAIAACEQCGRNSVPEIAQPVRSVRLLRRRIRRGHDATAALAARRPVDGETRGCRGGVTVLIGPEGGLTETEQEEPVCAGFQSRALGPSRAAHGDRGHRRPDPPPALLRRL